MRFVLVGILFLYSAASGDDWKSRFEREAPSAWRELSKRRMDFSFSCEKQGFDVNTNGETWKYLVEVKCGRNCQLARYLDKKSGAEDVFAVNSRYRFHIHRVSVNANWVVDEVVVEPTPDAKLQPDNFERPDNQANSEAVTTNELGVLLDGLSRGHRMIDVCGIKWGFYHTKGIYLSDCDDFEVTSAAQDVVDGISVVKVDVQWSIPLRRFFASLWCDPTRHWAIIKSTIRSPEQNYEINRYVKFHPESSSEFPVLTYMKKESRYVNGDVHELWEWTFSESAYGKRLPESQFRLSVYGIPEPPGVGWGVVQLPLVIGILGITIVAIALIMRRRQRMMNAVNIGKVRR